MASAIFSDAAAMRCWSAACISALAAAKPWRKLSSCALASSVSCSATVSLERLPRPSVPNSSSNRNFTGLLPGFSCVGPVVAVIMRSSVNQLVFGAAALRDHDLALGGEVFREVDHQRLRFVDV